MVNRGLEQYLRAFTHEKPKAWRSYLSWAEYSYNSSYHSSIKMTLYEAIYGRKPSQIPPYKKDTTSVQAVDEWLQDMHALLLLFKTNIREAKERMKQKTDADRHEVNFEVGDNVLVKLQPYRQTLVAKSV